MYGIFTFRTYIWFISYNFGKYTIHGLFGNLGERKFHLLHKKTTASFFAVAPFFRLQQDCWSRSTLDSSHTPTCRFSAKQPANARNWTKHPRAAPELPNCHRHSLHDPRKRQIHLPESQQRRVLWLESAWRPWADLELRNCHRHSLQHPR